MSEPLISHEAPQVVFLISLPRSGSTLLQKILAAHPKVASTGEPWILLPLAYIEQSKGVEAIYNHANAAKGVREMIGNLSEGRRTYIAHTRNFCMPIFKDLARGKPIFLDKDPRYYLILDFLVELFPTAKFIFLFRNPLDVMCSMMNTWLDGKLKLHAYHVDLYEGVRAISRGSRCYADRGINIHYSDLVQSPEVEVRRICDFLGIVYQDDMLENYRNVDFGGTMGDPKGVKSFKGVSSASVNVWPRALNNLYRIRFARRYLQALGDETLAPWRFSCGEFELALRQIKIRMAGSLNDFTYQTLSDMWRMLSGTRLRHMLQERKVGEVYLFR